MRVHLKAFARWARSAGVVAALVVGGTSCSDKAPDCTTEGCAATVTIHLADGTIPTGSAVSLCVDGRCEDFGSPSVGRDLDVLELDADLQREGVAQVELMIEPPDGQKRAIVGELAVREVRPNGPECPPTCFFVNADLTTDLALRDS